MPCPRGGAETGSIPRPGDLRGVGSYVQSKPNGRDCLWGVYPIGNWSRSEVAEQIKDEQDDEDQAEAAAAADMATVGVAAAAEEKNKDDNEEDEGHDNILEGRAVILFSAGEGRFRWSTSRVETATGA